MSIYNTTLTLHNYYKNMYYTYNNIVNSVLVLEQHADRLARRKCKEESTNIIASYLCAAKDIPVAVIPHDKGSRESTFTWLWKISILYI